MALDLAAQRDGAAPLEEQQPVLEPSKCRQDAAVPRRWLGAHAAACPANGLAPAVVARAGAAPSRRQELRLLDALPTAAEAAVLQLAWRQPRGVSRRWRASPYRRLRSSRAAPASPLPRGAPHTRLPPQRRLAQGSPMGSTAAAAHQQQALQMRKAASSQGCARCQCGRCSGRSMLEQRS